jgi:hypothetical protein
MKEIIGKLKQHGTLFTIKGITNWQDEPKQFIVTVTEYKHSSPITSISENIIFLSRSMNVEKFTAASIHLCDYDMFGQKSTFRIKYEDITIIEE